MSLTLCLLHCLQVRFADTPEEKQRKAARKQRFVGDPYRAGGQIDIWAAMNKGSCAAPQLAGYTWMGRSDPPIGDPAADGEAAADISYLLFSQKARLCMLLSDH